MHCGVVRLLCSRLCLCAPRVRTCTEDTCSQLHPLTFGGCSISVAESSSMAFGPRVMHNMTLPRLSGSVEVEILRGTHSGFIRECSEVHERQPLPSVRHRRPLGVSVRDIKPSAAVVLHAQHAVRVSRQRDRWVTRQQRHLSRALRLCLSSAPPLRPHVCSSVV